MSKTKLVRVITSIDGQIWRATAIDSGLGPFLSAVLMIRKDLEAPQESESSDVTNEKIWVLLILPVLRTMKTWVNTHLDSRISYCEVPGSQTGVLLRTSTLSRSPFLPQQESSPPLQSRES